MAKRKINWLKAFALSTGLGLLFLLVGTFFQSRALLFIGIVLFAPLVLACMMVLPLLAMNFVDESLPEFKGKYVIVLATFLVALLAMIVVATGGPSDDIACRGYRTEC